MARTGRYYNWGTTRKQFSYALLNAGQLLNRGAMAELGIVAEKWLKAEDAQWPHNTLSGKWYFNKSVKILDGGKFGGDHYHPWYTGQLHDSVAVRIAQKNRTISVHYMPPSSATGKPQHSTAEDGGKYDRIVGTEWAHMVAESKMPYFFLPGLQVQLAVAVPYAEKVNESGRHLGFFDYLADNLVTAVDDWAVSGGTWRNRVIADEKGARVVKQSNIRYV